MDRSQSKAVDVFSQSWKDINNWLVPPVSLVNKTVFHLLACRGSGTLIAPKWPSASFWPIIFQEGHIIRDFVKDILEFSTGQDIFVNDKGNKSIFGLEQKRLKAKFWLLE